MYYVAHICMQFFTASNRWNLGDLSVINKNYNFRQTVKNNQIVKKRDTPEKSIPQIKQI